MHQAERKWIKRKAKENYKRTVNEKRKEKSQPGGSLYFELKNQQEWRMADQNGSTDVSTTPLLGVLDTKITMYPMYVCKTFFIFFGWKIAIYRYLS
jgi:hypothetical protein